MYSDVTMLFFCHDMSAAFNLWNRIIIILEEESTVLSPRAVNASLSQMVDTT